MSMKAKKILLILAMMSLLAPAIHAENGIDIALGDYPFLVTTFDDCEIIGRERIPEGSFTTLHDHTFHWQNSTKVTYRNAEGKTGYLIVWRAGLHRNMTSYTACTGWTAIIQTIAKTTQALSSWIFPGQNTSTEYW